MNSEAVQWTEDRQRYLRDQLTGFWAEDVWVLNSSDPNRRQCRLRFTITSPSLKAEMKYVVWSKFHSGEWNIDARQDHLCKELARVIEWFNHFVPPIQSLLEKDLDQWVLSLRAYLLQTGRLKYRRLRKLSAMQEYVEYQAEDRRIILFHQLYSTIYAAYDNRPETEKDSWDMRKMGLTLNLTTGHHYLKFTGISQPWLRDLAKEFMRYRLAMHSPEGCRCGLNSIQIFSQFIAQSTPALSRSDVNRPLIVKFIGFLRESGRSDRSRGDILSYLRVFLETCAFQLEIEGVPKEQLIFPEDLPHRSQSSTREIPEGVLEQVREHLNSLPMPILRMVVILLECGMRISELCSLPLDCLTHDGELNWYLRFYQGKSKQEHVIPLVDETVVSAIRAQQQAVREQWGSACSFLFPSTKSPDFPFLQQTFTGRLNRWAFENRICDANGNLYHFQSHQFRHSVAMRLINEDVPLEVISRLLGHRSLDMTAQYARLRKSKLREELARTARKSKTVDYQGKVVTGDARANDLDVQLLRKGIRGQTLPVGGCGRFIVLGDCAHANKCLSCPFWLTSTEDLPALKAFQSKAVQLRQRASERGNSMVMENQDRLIPILAVRVKSLEDASTGSSPSVAELIGQLREDLVASEVGRDEVHEACLLFTEKRIEQRVSDLRARIAALEDGR